MPGVFIVILLMPYGLSVIVLKRIALWTAKEITVERTVGVDFHPLLAHKADENGQSSG